MSRFVVNGSYETELEIGESEESLGIKNKGRVNRNLATRDKIGSTAFSAETSHVEYGTFNQQPACLVVFDFAFTFKGMSLSRLIYAEIDITFTKAVDSHNPQVKKENPDLDPGVADLAPVEVWGVMKTVNETRKWAYSIPVMITKFAKAGVDINGGVDKSLAVDHRMNLNGSKLQDDDHPDYPHAVSWQIDENKAQKEGIIRRFRCCGHFNSRKRIFRDMGEYGAQAYV